MDNILARESIGVGYFCVSGRLIMTLRFHKLSALIPETHSRKGVDTVVDAAVTRVPAACHA